MTRTVRVPHPRLTKQQHPGESQQQPKCMLRMLQQRLPPSATPLSGGGEAQAGVARTAQRAAAPQATCACR
eukprot:scaffold215596_cov14-Tisochrysis_lutea.AAC.1